MTKILAIPHIHSNGTSHDTLLADLCDAITAINDAISVVNETYPNLRDYYPIQQPGTWGLAVEQHNVRVGKLREVRDELEAIAEAIR